MVGASSVFAADADGDRDVFATAWDGDAVYWFDNQGVPGPTNPPQPCPECSLFNWVVWLLLLIILLPLWYCFTRRHR